MNTGRETAGPERSRGNLSKKCTEIANKICNGPPSNCYGTNAKKWQAAWDAACTALGGDPEAFKV